VATEAPKGFPSKGSFKNFIFKASQMMCTDGIKQPYEIGVDCGKNACNAFCPPNVMKLVKDSPCDRKEDCKGDCKNGKCLFLPCSCTEIYNQDPGMKSGLYKLSVDSKVDESQARGDDKVLDNSEFEVYCDVEYDKDSKFKGVYTLVEMIHSGQHWNNYFNYYGKMEDHATNDMGQKWKANSKNQAKRFGVVKFNSIFKHSLGIVMTRYNHNRAGYQLTDVFGSPETNKHILDKGNSCSQRKTFNLARAYRYGSGGGSNGRGGATMGFCFNRGQYRQNNNCICGDKWNSQFRFNVCPGQHGNMRRFNTYTKENRKCYGMHTKCHGYGNHGIMGDSYGCDKPGQRGVGGHMWFGYYGNTGLPGPSPGNYGYYGSRWIK